MLNIFWNSDNSCGISRQKATKKGILLNTYNMLKSILSGAGEKCKLK